MLVLTRKTGESIVIGNDVVVTVLEVRGDQIRIGIDAPRSIQVHREEVYEQVAAENAAAATQRLGDRQRKLLQTRITDLPGRQAPQGGGAQGGGAQGGGGRRRHPGAPPTP